VPIAAAPAPAEEPTQAPIIARDGETYPVGTRVTGPCQREGSAWTYTVFAAVKPAKPIGPGEDSEWYVYPPGADNEAPFICAPLRLPHRGKYSFETISGVDPPPSEDDSSEASSAQARAAQDEVGHTDARGTFKVGLCRDEQRGYCNVKVVYRTFIPSPLIAGPAGTGTVFGADDRGFSEQASAYRSQQRVTVNVDPDRNQPIVAGPERNFGESSEYEPEDAIVMPAKPSWWRGKRPGAKPICKERLTVTEKNSSVKVEREGRNQIAVHLRLAGSLPACNSSVVRRTAPDIDHDVTINIRQQEDEPVYYKVGGKHDGFPAHELYLDHDLAHAFDPVAKKTEPSNLFPPMDVRVDVAWRKLR
jgi:hypothetical protein